MRAQRARVVGVPLALAHLVAARPVGQSNASVVPFSQSSAEFAQARRALTGYVMTDRTIRTAVTAWLSNSAAAEATYGHISTWETGGVTGMSDLFNGASSFNEDIGAWDTSGVTTMGSMFSGASAFDQDLGGWAIHSVKDMSFMFYEASAFDQDLGWCVDDDVSLSYAFSSSVCESTSCGVVQKDENGICPVTDSTIRTAVDAWLANATAAEATYGAYGHISTWETGGVTDMSYLFCAYSGNSDCHAAAESFNEDITAWDTSGVTTMQEMFREASAFNQDLGWCLDDDVDLRKAFKGTNCQKTLCGVAQKDEFGTCDPGTRAGYISLIVLLLVLLAGAGAYVRCKKKKDETYAAAARRVLCRRGTKVRAVAPTTSDEAPVLPASMVRVVDAPAAGIAPGELGTVVSVKH